MGAPASVPPPETPAHWECERKPQGSVRVWTIIIGLLLCAGGALFGAMIDLQRAPWYGLGVGVLMALLFAGAMARGCKLSLHDNLLCYSVAGKPNYSTDLRNITEIKMVHAGMLRGIGLLLDDYAAVQFHHKSGTTVRGMERDRTKLGVDVTCEFFTAEDCQVLIQHWQQARANTSSATSSDLASEA